MNNNIRIKSDRETFIMERSMIRVFLFNSGLASIRKESIRMYNRDVEIREAVMAGERALSSLRNAEKSLKSARGWGFYDILGGGTISGLVKHKKVGDARDSLYRAQADLEAFSRELADVRDIQSLRIEIGDFLTFADFFFDGFFADVMVQSKLNKAQDEISAAIRRVENLLGQLRRYGGH